MSKDDWIREVVKGKTFADIGGLWGTVNEKVSVAIKAGCRQATMVDISPLGSKMWVDFDEHCQDLGVSGYRRMQADVTDQNLRDTIGQYQVVHCSGVIYHVPDPFLMLRNLRAVTEEYLILTSMTVPPNIETVEGNLELQGGIAYLVAALNETQRRIFAAHFENEHVTVGNINGRSRPWLKEDGTPSYAPWWWLWTSDFVKQMVEACGFEVVKVIESWKGKSHSFLCQLS